MNPAPLPRLEPPAARCAFHPELAAAVTCARCGTFACFGCQTVASDGLAYCMRCLSQRAPLNLATPGSRFVANLVDTLVLVAPTVIAVVVALVASGGGEDEDVDAAVGLLFILGTVGALFLQLGFQLGYGQSVGKRVFRLRVVRPDGTPASFLRVLLVRNLLMSILTAVLGIIGLVDALMIFGERRRCLHDYMADTDVIAES